MNDQLSFEGMSEPGVDELFPPDAGAPEDGMEAGRAMTIYSNQPSFDREDIFIPRLRLAQGLTKEVQEGTARPGQWVMTGYEALSEITVLPVMFAKRRELTSESFQVLCKSDDSQHGVGDPGGECSKCPMNKWVDGDKGKRNPPKCSFIYSYVVYVKEYDTQAILEFKRTSINVGKGINTAIMQHGVGKVAFILKATTAQGPKGTYYTASASPSIASQELKDAASALLNG